MQREITRELVRRLLPGRMAESNKGSYGSVLAAAGSMAYRGAAALCTEGALRGGAGLVYLASVEPVIQLVLSRTPECCACGCRTAANGGIHPQDADALRRWFADRHAGVNAGGVPFVTMSSYTQMSSRTNDDSTLLIPTWPAFERDVYPETELYSALTDKDKGGLKGILLARGSIEVDYTDIPVKPDKADYDLTTADGKAAYDKDYAKYQEKQEYYNKYIEPSVILSALAGVDKLMNGIVTKINDVLCPEKDMKLTTALTDENGNEIMPNSYSYTVSDAVLYDKYKNEVKGFDNGDGTYSYESSEPLYTDKDLKNKADVTSYNYTVLDMDKTDYGMDEDKTVGTEIFGRLNTKRYIKMKDANGNDMYVHNNQNEKGDRSEYKLGNIIMNSDAEQDIAKIPMTTLQGKEDMAKGQELIDAWNGDFASINPQMYAVGNFSTYYNNFIGEFSTVGKVLYNYVDHQQTMVDGYDDQRLQSEGVASDEELEKMIKYQQAYNASSRYVNVISEMLEHIVTALGS